MSDPFVGLWLGGIVGAGLAALCPPRWRGRRGTRAALRHATAQTGYRDAAHEVVRDWADVVDAVREAGVAVRRPRADRFELGDPRQRRRRLRVRTTDPARVTLASLEIVDHGSELLIFELALALVTRFGPIVVVEALHGRFVVDGSRDAEALREDRAERIRALARGVQDDILDRRAVFDAIRRES